MNFEKKSQSITHVTCFFLVLFYFNQTILFLKINKHVIEFKYRLNHAKIN